jgi:hypothetical protein
MPVFVSPPHIEHALRRDLCPPDKSEYKNHRCSLGGDLGSIYD